MLSLAAILTSTNVTAPVWIEAGWNMRRAKNRRLKFGTGKGQVLIASLAVLCKDVTWRLGCERVDREGPKCMSIYRKHLFYHFCRLSRSKRRCFKSSYGRNWPMRAIGRYRAYEQVPHTAQRECSVVI